MNATARILRDLPAVSASLVIICLISLGAQAAGTWGRYRQVLAAEEPIKEYGAFALNEATYAHARADLADLRIVNETGRFVPLAFRPAPIVRPERRPAAIFNHVFKGDKAEVTVDVGPGAFLHDELEVDLDGANEFIVMVMIEGSDDGRTWGTLAEDLVLARLTGGGSYVDLDSLAYPPCRFRFLRLSYRDRLHGARLRLTGAGCGVAPERQPPLHEWPAKMSTENSVNGGTQLVTLDLGCRLPVEEIALRINTASYHRPVELEASSDGEVWTRIAWGSFFRYDVAGTVAVQDRIEFAAVREMRFYRLRIAKDDDEPLAITGAVIRGRPDEVVFATNGQGPFYLAYGVEDAAPARYDLSILSGRMPQGAFARWSLSGAEERLGGNQPSWPLWLGLTGAVAILAGAAVLALRRMETGGGE